MPLEIEAKIKVDDLVDVRAKLNALGATNEGEADERNWVLDDAGQSLKARGFLLRVRSLGETGGILTVKRPIAEGGEFKTREEVETMVDSTHDLLKQLEILGYRTAWIYEKRRQTWLWRDCVIALDECPEIGSFVEIEGSPESIRLVCADLGLDPDTSINDNYLTLWRRHLEEKGEAPRNMEFDRARNADDPDLANLEDLLL